ncbi:MAG: Phytoene dehydrogenase [Acidimicrobiales bacterium]|nr:Phytoene dehydrogenase [Acidimicrobiales bacterium]
MYVRLIATTFHSERFDAVVVGAGPNGLAAAVTLAEAGRSVLVLEGSDSIGGGTRSAALTLPGFVHDVCAAVHALGIASPAFAEMQLDRHGLEWIHPGVPLAHPLDGGRAGVLHRTLGDTMDGMGADGAAWRRMFEPLLRHWDDILPQILGPIVSVPRHPLAMAQFGMRALPPASIAQRAFSTEEAAALFGGCSAHAFLPLTRPLSAAFGTMLALIAQATGWPVAKGGSQAVADAMAARLRELGGVIETGRAVASLRDLPPHRVAFFDTNPAQLERIAGSTLPDGYRRRLRNFRHGPAAFKIDYALDGPVPWTNEACRTAGTVHVGGTFAEIRDAEADCAAGRMPARPFVLVAQQSLFDPSRAPAGKHTLWAYAHVPHASPVDATDALEAQIERFAPGFRDLILAKHVMAPLALQEYNPNYVGGDIGGGAHSGAQLVFRPTFGLRSYVTPNPRILLCSASTPPGGGVHGMAGRRAAHTALAGVLR